MLYAIILFVLAGLAEIGGGYLVWLWLREGMPFWYGIGKHHPRSLWRHSNIAEFPHFRTSVRGLRWCFYYSRYFVGLGD